jgi:adenylate cyclase
MSLLAELKRRNVVRAVAAYVAVAWLLIQVAETTFPAFGLSERALRLLILALAIGFVPATALAWVFELTPEGFKRERDLDRSGPLATRTNRLLDRAIVALLALGLTYFAVDKFFLSPARERARVEQAIEQGRTEALEEQLGDKSIVVLPFTNLSADPDQEFFADGMAEELLNLLARIPELRVISRTSAFAFKGKDAGVAEIAAKLRVSHVLEGSVRRSGDRLRITAQLIDAKTDSHLWSETYDRTLDDVFEVQDEIAARVVDALKIELIGDAPKARRTDPQAHVLVMQAWQLLDGQGNLAKVAELLQRALAIDGTMPSAWTAMSWLHYRCSLEDYRETEAYCRSFSIEQARRLSEEHRLMALEIDPADAVAIAYGAFKRAFAANDWPGAAPEFERAVRLGPTQSDVLRSTILYALYIQRPQIAVHLAEFAVARDPLCRQCIYFLARAYRNVGRLDEAESTMRNFAAATGLGGWSTIGMLRLAQGDAQGALEALANIEYADDVGRLQGRAMALHGLGREDEALAELARLEARWPDQYDAAAVVYAWRGEADRSLECLERAAAAAIESDDRVFDWTNPILRTVLQTPRGQALLREFGVADEQLAEIRFEPRLPGDP